MFVLLTLVGVSSVEFPVEILHNSAVEWHETFYVALGPGLPENAVFGKVSSAMITILDNEVSGSLILPAPPVVRTFPVSLVVQMFRALLEIL